VRTRADLQAALREIRSRSGLGYKAFEVKAIRLVQSGAITGLTASPLPDSSLHRAIEQGNLRWFASPPARLEVFLRVAGCPIEMVASWLEKLSELAPAGPQRRLDLDHLKSAIVVDHERLFGVDEELDRLAQFLANRSGDWIISILGEPGVGKTALAYEMVLRHAESAGFQRIAAVSAKFSQLHPAGRLEALPERVAIDWRDLLVDLAGQLRLDADLRPDTIEERMPAAMPAQPCLILIDNLETVPEARFAVRYLSTSGLVRPHKVVLTTRTAVGQEAAFAIRERRWTGPDRAACHAYADYLARDDPTLTPSPEDLDDVVEAAERVPLLIKIIMSQAIFGRLPIRQVIARLRQRGGELGSALWQYCYADSLTALASRIGEEATERLMSVFCAKAGGSSFTSGELRALSGLGDQDELERAIAAACQLSLMRSHAGNTRFTVHSLLRQFYCGDIDDGDIDDGDIDDGRR